MSKDYALTKNGSFIPIQELTHGLNIRYVDLDEDEMMHWKYIKRVKLSNGKYRYYYDESVLTESVKKAEAMNARAAAAIKQAAAAYTAKPTAQAKQKVFAAYRHQQYTQDLVKRVTKEYEKKKIASFPARIISKGIVAVANWLPNLGSKKRK